MERFIKKILAFILPLMLIISLTNIVIDPGNLFSGIELEIAEYLVSGSNVTGSFNIDERELQKRIIGNKDSQPEIVVIGSSRIQQIGSDIYGDGTLNNSVSGTSIEDIVAIYQLYLDNDKLPKKIIIGIDPWLFNENNDQNRWKTWKELYYAFNNSSSSWHESIPIFKYSQILSISYFQSSLKNIKRKLTKKNQFKKTNDKINDTFTRRTDGTIYYDKDYINITEKEIEERATSFISKTLYSLEKYPYMSKELIKTFEFLIENIRKKNIEIEFILMPYHPIVYDYIQSKEKYLIVDEVEEYIKAYVNDKNITLIGSYNPYNYNLQTTDFYDGMHSSIDGILKVMGKGE